MQSAEPRTYRATREAWLGQFLLPVVFFALLTVTAVNASGLNPWVGGLGLATLALFAALDFLLPMLRNWLYTDYRSLEGSLDGRYFHVYWSEVLAAWIFRRGRRRFLCIGTREQTYIVPLRFFDAGTVWETVRSAVPPAALVKEAIQRLPDYREWQTARAQALENITPCTVADHWLLQVAGWSGLTFFLLGFANALQSGAIIEAGLSAALAAVSAAVLVNWGLTEFDEQGIQRYTLLSGWRITWEEVRWIEIDPFDAVMVLGGDDYQLVIPGPGLWSGGQKQNSLARLLAQVERHNLPLRRTTLALTRRSRRTSVRR